MVAVRFRGDDARETGELIASAPPRQPDPVWNHRKWITEAGRLSARSGLTYYGGHDE